MHRNWLFEKMSAQRLRIFRERQTGSVCSLEESPDGFVLSVDLDLIRPGLYSTPALRRAYERAEAKCGRDELEP